MQNLEPAIDAWLAAIGKDAVVTTPVELAACEQATYATGQRIPAAIFPATREQVQACVRIANEHRVPIYPISRGKNWGYGSKVPVKDSVLMSLERMDQVVAFDDELGILTVQPGVTFGQAYEFLCEHGPTWLLSGTGSSPHASLIGNTVERGVGTGPRGDRFSSACNLEVVLPTGGCIRTGFGAYQGAAAMTNRWGIGPAIDGLFTQSNYGIVTEMSFWLAPRPAYYAFVSFGFSSKDQLKRVTSAVRWLKLHDILRTNVPIFNAYRLIPTAEQQYPWEETAGKTPLDESLAARLSKQRGMAAWNGVGAMYCASARQARAEKALIRKQLGPHVDSLRIFTRDTMKLVRLIRYPFRWIAGFDAYLALKKLFDENMFMGHPPKSTIYSVYWRKRTPAPPVPDPNADQCGLIWLSPSVPLQADHVERVVGILESGLRQSGFEPGITLNCVTDRCVNVVSSVVYDREVDGEDERAMACYDDLVARLEQAGYLPYRLGIHAMKAPQQSSADTLELRRQLRKLVDPNGVVAPGRYELG